MTDLTDPIAVALLSARTLEAHSLRYALYGGLMLAAYGEPRETRDADLAVAGLDADRVRDAFEAGGVSVSVNFRDMTFGGLRVSRLAILDAPDATGLNTVDLVEPRSVRYARDVLDRSVRAPLRGVEIVVVTPEDFVLLKALSTRERDLDDAAGVLKRMAADLDLAMMEDEVVRLAAELPDADVVGRFGAIRTRAGI